MNRESGTAAQRGSRPACPADVADARRRVGRYVDEYNHVRLHGAFGYVAPADKLNGLDDVIFAERDRKLEEAGERRAAERRAPQEVA